MTDIIFKTNITQPASNVANLNFVDGVIKLNANSTIGFNAECSFSTFSVTSVMSKIELNLAASFTELVPLDVFIPESSKGIIPAIGFHIVNQGDGDPYFEQAKLLCHFNKLLGNGGFYDEKNRKRGLAYDNSYPKRFFDGDSKITYIDDSDSFEGNVVSTDLYQHFIFGDYIEPVNLRYSKLLTTDEQVFYSYKSAVQTNFTSHGSDLTLKINLNGTIKTYQEWFDYFSELENRCAPYMLLNGALIKIADYTGDYGRNLSVRGKDWCLEARFKITGANLLSETNSANSFDLFSTKDILLNVSIKYKINYKINDGISVLDSFELDKISFTLNPSASNLNFIQWDVTSAIDNNFSDVKLCCTDGQYELFFDGIKIPVTLNNFYDYYKVRISNGSIFLDNFKKTNENYHKFGLFIWNELPYYQSANDVVFRGAFHQQDYFFGIDRFYVTVNSVEVIFDGVTFVENSFTIDVPFDLIFNTSLRCRNYEIYVSILNNRFIIEVEQYDFVYLDINGVDIRISGNPTQDIERRLVTTISREFIATVKNWDSKIYDKNYSNLINVQGRYLDEMRFTIGDARIKESLYATEPFPNFIENRIAIEAQFDLSAVYQFGSNNFIKFEPKITFKDFTKKPKNTIPPTTPIAIEFSNLSLIEFLPKFSIYKENVFEISIISNSNFSLSPYNNATPIPTPTPAPVITPIRLSKITTIEPLAAVIFAVYPAIHVKYETDISVESDVIFELINPIRIEQESEIAILIDLTLKQIKTELVYLSAENRSKASTGFVDKLLEGNGVASIFDNGTIEFYTGNRPYSANHAVTGTFLGELKNIKFGTPINRIIRKDESQTWLLTAINSGRIGWFRIKADVASDYGQDSIREVRLDGEAGVDAAAIDFSVKAGDYYHVQDFAVMWGNG